MILNIVGASSLVGGGIGKLRKQLSFGNTFFQIAKRRCKVFWGLTADYVTTLKTIYNLFT